MESKLLAFGLFILFCIVQSSTALKCYTCHGAKDQRCNDNQGVQAQECPPPSTLFNEVVCMKAVVRQGSQEIVARNCGEKMENIDPCTFLPAIADGSELGISVEFCDVCDTDRCNSGNPVQLFSTIIVFGAMACIARLFV